MTKANADIRKTAKANDVPLWAIAQKMGICEMTMSRKLRTELPQPEKEKIFSIIKELAETEGN